MLYRRMRIEVESPEEMGYGRIRNNLSESSITDRTLGDFTVDLSGLLLPYGEHRGEPRLRELIVAQGGDPSLTPHDVLVTQGAAGALFIVATSLLEKESHLVVVRPNYATNGGCYNHAAGFKAVADCMMGRAEAAWRTLIKVAPDSPWNPIRRSWAEPFAFNNCYDLIPEIYGRAQYPWRTGTAAWFTMALVEWMLGARRSYAGLLLDPCLSREVPPARLVRTFRGARFEIELDNRAGRCKGARSITLNGQPVNGRV